MPTAERSTASAVDSLAVTDSGTSKTGTTQTSKPGSSESRSSEPGSLRLIDLILPFACLLLVEVIAFGINVKSVGVYQDEWISFGSLHFVNQTIPDLMAAFNADPRKIVRPLQFLNIPVLFYFFKESPLWYHIASYTTEFFSGCFLYLAVSRLAASRAVALGAAILFLLYPTHNSTHYSIVLLNGALDTMFFTMSLWLFIKGLQENRLALLLGSSVAFCASIYTREDFVPMVVAFPVIAILHTCYEKRENLAKNLGRVILYSLPAFLAVASLVFYRGWLLPHLKLGWKYHQVYSLSNFLSVMEAGLRCNLSPDIFAYCVATTERALSDGVALWSWVLLAATVSFVFVALVRAGAQSSSQQLAAAHSAGKSAAIANADGKSASVTSGKNIRLAFVGLVLLVVSYTLFGLSPEHMPTLEAWLNRVNMGGSLGACLIIAALLGLTTFRKSRRLSTIIFAANISLLAGLFILTNWQLAESWKVSWKAQKALMIFLRSHASEIKPGDSIIIGDIGRYTSKETPVVDGDWDWENIVRTTLDDPTLKGTVVTERLYMEGEALIDPPCGTYEFNKMLLFSPKRGAYLTRVSSREDFLKRAQELGWTIPTDKSQTEPASPTMIRNNL